MKHSCHFNLQRRAERKHSLSESKKNYSEETPTLKLDLTSNNKFSRTLCLAKRVNCNNFIFTAVLWLDSENEHGAYTKRVGDVVAIVRVDADAIQVPGYIGCRAASDSTCHVELVTLRWRVDFQRDQDRRRPLKRQFTRRNSI